MISYGDMIDSFEGKKILLLGDVMIDHYSYGEVDRISPEAPVPIIHIVREDFVPGGAGNVCINLMALGAQVEMITVTGRDEMAKKLKNFFTDSDKLQTRIIEHSGRKTTVKQRLVAGNQQILRVDTEDHFELSKDVESEVLSALEGIGDIDCICVSDYAKGFVTKKIAERLPLMAQQNKVPIIVDTKPKNFNLYKNCSLITPNQLEVRSTYPELTDEEASVELSRDTNSPILVTRGADGMSLVNHKGGVVFDLPSYAKDVRDVSGAGDTVVSVVALALAAKVNLKEAAYIASKAAAIAVSKNQTSSVSPKELKNMT